MQNTRRARAIAIAKAEDGSKLRRWSFFVIAVGATAALLAAPKFF